MNNGNQDFISNLLEQECLSEDVEQKQIISSEDQTEDQTKDQIEEVNGAQDEDNKIEKAEDLELDKVTDFLEEPEGKSEFDPKEKFSDIFREELERLENQTLNPTLKLPRIYFQIPENDLYIQSCELLKIIPVAEYLENITCETLNLRNRSIGPLGVKALAKCLMNNATLTHLDLSGNCIGNEGLAYIEEMMKENGIITHLSLARNNLGVLSSEPLQEILANNSSVRVLDLSENGIRDNQALKMAAGLQVNRGVWKLDLSHNNLTVIGGRALGAAIAKNECLQKLSLKWNMLSGEGASGLCSGLRVNQHLRTLNLSWNGFNDDSATFLSNTIQSNSTLLEIDLANNNCTDNGVEILCRGFKSNDTIQVFSLANNPITAIGATVLLKTINRPSNQMQVLDLMGVRVNKEFLKTLKAVKDSDRLLSVKFGRNIRASMFPKNYFFAKTVNIRDNHPLEVIQEFADDKGLTMKNVLKKILDTFLNPPPVEKTEEDTEASPSKPEMDAVKSPCMKYEDFIKALVNCEVQVPDEMADNLAKRVVQPDGAINLRELIKQLYSRVDDMEDEVPEPMIKEEPQKKDDKKKK